MTNEAEPPLLLTAGEAARLCGRSEASWWRDNSAGRCPMSVKIGGSTRWRRSDLVQWVQDGCPPRNTKRG